MMLKPFLILSVGDFWMKMHEWYKLKTKRSDRWYCNEFNGKVHFHINELLKSICISKWCIGNEEYAQNKKLVW